MKKKAAEKLAAKAAPVEAVVAEEAHVETPVAEAEAAIPSVKEEFPNASNFKWSRWSLNGLRPKITWVLSYQLDGHFEIYEEWNGAAEYNSKAEAESVIKDVEYEYPNSTDWKTIRCPLR
jgi:hypothetical protein